MKHLINIAAIIISFGIIGFATFSLKTFFSKKQFIKPLILMIIAITLPPLILQIINFICIIFPNYDFSFAFFIVFGFVYILSAIIFLIYIFAKKLPNRKFVLILTSICFIIMNTQGLLYYLSVPYQIYMTYYEEYSSAFNYIEDYKTKNGIFPKNIDQVEGNRIDFPDYIYETFDNGKNYVLHVYKNNHAWTKHSDEISIHVVPYKWVVYEKGNKYWIEIPKNQLKDYIYTSTNKSGSSWIFDYQKYKEKNH